MSACLPRSTRQVLATYGGRLPSIRHSLTQTWSSISGRAPEWQTGILW